MATMMKIIKKLFLLVLPPMLLFNCISCGDKKNKRETSGLFLIWQNDKVGYIDRKGKIVIKPIYDWADNFYEDLAIVEVNGKYGYIDVNGNNIINPQFEIFNPYHNIYYPFPRFKEGLALVRVGDKWGFIDKNGKIVINPQFEGAHDFNDGLSCVEVGGKYGHIEEISTGSKIVLDSSY